MNKITLVLLGLLCSFSTSYAAQQSIDQLAQPATIGAFRTAVNSRLSKVQSNFVELYTNKAEASCFATEAAFNTCFALDWPTGTAYTLPTATGSVLGGIKIGTGLSIDGSGIVSATGTAVGTIDDLTDVDTTGKATGKVLKFNSSGNLIVGDDNEGAGSLPTCSIAEQVPRWNGSSWGCLTIGTSANNLIALNSSGRLPFTIDLSNLTDTTAILAGKQGTLSLPSQAEAEAGTATDARSWSAERVAQAIAAQAGTGSLSITESATDPTLGSLSVGDIAVSRGSGDLFIRTTTGGYVVPGTYTANPTLTSATISSMDTDTLLTLASTGSENLARASEVMNVDCSTGGDGITATYVSGAGSASLVYTLGTTVYSGETCDLDYTSGITSSASGLPLSAITSGAITNNSTQSSGTWNNFDGQTDNVEISTISGWTQITDGTAAIVVDNDGTTQAGSGCAVGAISAANSSAYRAALAQTQQYYLVTLYIYLDSGQSAATVGGNFSLRGNTGSSTITFGNILTNGTTYELQIFGGGDYQYVQGFTAGQWNKIEIELNNTAHTWRASVNDGTPSSAYSYQNNYALTHIQIQNDGTMAGNVRFDTISGTDGGTL